MTRLKTACGAVLVALWATTAGAHWMAPGAQWPAPRAGWTTPGADWMAPAPVRTIHGAASWYGPGFHGRLTASGERFNQNEMTAAHKKLPFGTRVRVTNQANGRSVVVRINDRGPFVGKRIIDLSRGAARKIGLLHRGVGPVTVEVLPRV